MTTDKERRKAFEAGQKKGLLRGAEIAENWLPKYLGLNRKCADAIRAEAEKVKEGG